MCRKADFEDNWHETRGRMSPPFARHGTYHRVLLSTQTSLEQQNLAFGSANQHIATIPNSITPSTVARAGQLVKGSCRTDAWSWLHRTYRNVAVWLSFRPSDNPLEDCKGRADWGKDVEQGVLDRFDIRPDSIRQKVSREGSTTTCIWRGLVA